MPGAWGILALDSIGDGDGVDWVLGVGGGKGTIVDYDGDFVVCWGRAGRRFGGVAFIYGGIWDGIERGYWEGVIVVGRECGAAAGGGRHCEFLVGG